MSIHSPDEIYRYIGGALESLLHDPDVGPRLAERRLRIRFGFVDPDCVLNVDTERREVRLGRDDSVPSAMFAMNGATANLCGLGRLDVMSAIARGDIVADGDVEALLELLANRSGIFPKRYVEVLRREGRQDLLAS